MDSEVRFTEIYRTNAWTGKSRSGPGSDEENTRAVKKFLPEFIKQYDIKWMVDIPCGDYNWMSQIELGCDYIGCDIVRELVEANKKQYPNVCFEWGDLEHSVFRKIDLVFIRDGLVHLPTETIKKVFKNIASCKYVMKTHFTGQRVYRDIQVGQWRPINWCLEPWNLEYPMCIYNEEYNDNAWADKSMGVWECGKL